MTPPKSPNPRAKKAPRGKSAAARGGEAPNTVVAKKTRRPKSKAKKSLREAAKEALATRGETAAREGEGSAKEKADGAASEKSETVALFDAAEARASPSAVAPDGSATPPRRPTSLERASLERSPSTPIGTRPAWDGRPYNPRAAASAPPEKHVFVSVSGPKPKNDDHRDGLRSSRPATPRRVAATTSVSACALASVRAPAKPTTRGRDQKGSLRRGTTVRGSVFPAARPETFLFPRDAGRKREETKEETKKAFVAPLTLNVSGDASAAQKALTQKREEEKAEKAAAAAAARAAARARVLSARKKVEESCGRPSRAPETFEATPSDRPRSATCGSSFSYASERQRAQECLERRGRFSDALLLKQKRADARRPTMAYGELCPLNAGEEKIKFLRGYERYKRGVATELPPDPVFEYADPEAARVAMRRWGLPRDEFLAHAERVIAKRRELFPPRRAVPEQTPKAENALRTFPTEESVLQTRLDESRTEVPETHDREDPEIEEDERDDDDTDEKDDTDSFARAAWGERVATQALEEEARRYLAKHEIADVVTLRWHDDLSTPSMTTTTSRDPHTGVSIAKGVLHLPRSCSDDCADKIKMKCPREGSRKKFYRKRWIAALLDHEIGTHFAIAANDAAQGDALRDAGTAFGGGSGGIDDTRSFMNANGFPSNKAKGRGFGASGAATPRERLVTEEGLATLNTHRCAGVKILYGPALAYWTRWHASKLSFSELFERLEEHIPSVNARWTQCVRSKRGLVETKQRKACAKDQCYFEGAVRLLEARRLLDFKLLHGGKIALEEYADAKQAALRHSQRRGKIARRLGAAAAERETLSRPATARGSVGFSGFSGFSVCSGEPEPEPEPEQAKTETKNYLRGIRGGVSSASLVDAVASALRSQTLMETASARTVEPHFLADEARYLAELEMVAEANGIEAKDDVATRAVAGWAPRRGASSFRTPTSGKEPDGRPLAEAEAEAVSAAA